MRSRREVLRIVGGGVGLAAVSAADQLAAAAPLLQRGPAATPVIRTLLKDITPESLGTAATLFHEHLSFEWARVRGPNGRGPATGPAKEVKPLADELDLAAAEGVGCIVDAGTNDVGRDVAFLKSVAAATRVHVVACGGLYMQRTYPADVTTKSEDQIADDLTGRAGQCGAFGEIGETPDAPMSRTGRLRAVGKAHVRTSLPGLHAQCLRCGSNVPKDAGLKSADAFESAGVRGTSPSAAPAAR